MKRDLLQQAYSAMRHDLRKTLLTMLGMAWVLRPWSCFWPTEKVLDAHSKHLREFGATAVGIFPGRTSQEMGQ